MDGDVTTDREIEAWIIDRYGRIWFSQLQLDSCTLHVAAVPVSRGVALGVGTSRELAMRDLFCDLTPLADPRKYLPEWMAKQRSNPLKLKPKIGFHCREEN